jgi:hypothetical protein
MISMPFVVSKLPELLHAEGLYGDDKYKGLYPQRDVPLKGIQSNHADIEFTNYLTRYKVYRQGINESTTPEDSRHMSLKASQALLKFLNTGRTLVRAFTAETQGISVDVADARTMLWIRTQVFPSIANAQNTAASELHNDFDIHTWFRQIDTAVQWGDQTAAPVAAENLFVSQARYCVAAIAEIGYLPNAGNSSDGVSEYLPPDGIQQTLFV